jgi:Mg2+-importing ATPase
MIRTAKKPLIDSSPSIYVFYSTTMAVLIALILPYISLSYYLGLAPLPPVYYTWLLAIVLLYISLVQIVKMIYIKIYKNWL